MDVHPLKMVCIGIDPYPYMIKTHILSYRRSPPSPTARTYRSQRQFPGVERRPCSRRRRRRAGAGHGGRLRRQRHGARRGRGVGVGAPGLLLGLYYIIE